jgi:hypothetical protein
LRKANSTLIVTEMHIRNTLFVAMHPKQVKKKPELEEIGKLIKLT